ncbi:sensor domain-containing diguanylate cyclase [Ketobacter alkanivorans]|uniref:sensor domain-containing diguanylate cyclase n=1 Tax=Ketobacter alkanivorans TaxID=1917421 RepID=UPI0013158CCD|nr:sensor domain-containing diguanylate cyclase [Ketobacter alkanivorans]
MKLDKIDYLAHKITKNNKSFSLLAAAGWLCLLVFSGPVLAETIEILYEQGGSGGFSSSDWPWVVFALLATFLVALWVQRTQYQQRLQDKEEELERSHARLRNAQRIARIGSWTRDFETGETFWSKEALSVLGIDANDEALKHYETLIHQDDIDRVTEVIATAYFQGGNYQCDHRVANRSGQEKYIRLAGQVFLGDGSGPVHETGTVQDITDRKLAELALQRSEERMRSILDAAPYPILILEVAEEYPVLYANRSAYQLFGIDPNISSDELKSREFWSEGLSRSQFIDAVVSENHVFETEMVMKGRSSHTFWASLTGSRLEFGGVESVFISVMDITDRKRIQQELERLATTDPLTGIYNRRSFFESAHKEMRRAVRYSQPFAILMMDIDNFKSVNDNYGHQFGDSVLRRYADIVQSLLREEDLMGRVGGEEFCALLVFSAEQGGYVVAERIRKRWMDEVFELNEQQLSFSVSIGVSTLVDDSESIEDIIERADVGLYTAKRSGRNCVIVHNGEVGPRLTEKNKVK